MVRHLLLTVAAAALVGAALPPDDALAHARGHIHTSWHRAAHHRYLWGPDPRASRAGYYGPHYGRDCYRAAGGRAICPIIHESL